MIRSRFARPLPVSRVAIPANIHHESLSPEGGRHVRRRDRSANEGERQLGHIGGSRRRVRGMEKVDVALELGAGGDHGSVELGQDAWIPRRAH